MKETVFDRDKRIRNAALTMGQTFYLCTLNQFVGKNADAWPSQTAIAWAMNATKRGVQKWQAELEAAGIIRVDVGKGRSLTNRYRLNLGALQPKPDANDEHSSPFKALTDEQIANTVRPNDEHSSPEMTNTVRTERTMKEQVKNKGDSIPESLDSEPFRNAWGEWLEYRRQRKQSLTPATIGKQLKKLAAWGPVVAIQSIEQSIEHGWQGLFELKANGKTSGNTEAETAWQSVLDSLKRRSRFKPDEIMGDVGERAWQALKPIGLKKIDEANDFDRRELKAKFIQAFSRQGAAA